MQFYETRMRAVGRGLVVAVVVIVIILAAAGGYYLTRPTPSTSTTSSSSNSSSTSQTSQSSTQSTSATGGTRDTLVIDDVFWPSGDLNQLNTLGEIPYPNWLAYTVYQSMITLNASALYNHGTIQYLPDLAQSFTQSSDGRTYTFHLRQGVTFSNGDPLNAYQVWGQMYGLYYLSGNNSAGWFESYNVFDYSQVSFGPSTLKMLNQSGLISPSAAAVSLMSNQNWPIYVTDPNTIVFHLKGPFNYFLGTLVVYNGMIFDTQWVLKHGGFGTSATFNPYFNQHPIPGTGPYVVTQVSENAFVKFTQNPTYWGNSLSASDIAANPYLSPGHAKNVIVNAKFDDIARYTDLSTGQAQIAGILSQDYRLVLSQPAKFGEFLFPAKAAVFVGIALNTQRYPTNITAVRQAIVHAVNVTDISSKVFFGGLSPMVGPEYPIFSDFYNLGNHQPYSYNLTLAKQILSNAGIDPTKLPAVEFRVVVGCDYCISAAEIVSNDLGQLGMTVNIIVTPSTQYTTPNTGGTQSYTASLAVANQISHLTWFGTGTFAPAADTPADNWLLSVNNMTGSNNWAIYSNPTVQKCVNGFTTISDTATLQALCTAAQAQVYNDAPYIWLGTLRPLFGAGSVVWDKSVVTGFYVDPVFSGQSSTVFFNTVTFAG